MHVLVRTSHDQLMLRAALALNWIAFLTPKLLLDNVKISRGQHCVVSRELYV